MATGLFQAGFNAKGRINNAAYAFQTYSCRDIFPDQDVTNTEQIPGNPLAPALAQTIVASNVGEACIPGTGHMEATVTQATFDALNNPFVAPAALNGGSYISLRIYVNGTAGVSWYASSFYARELSQNGDVRALQPVSFTGRSDGYYTIPAT